MRKKQALTGLAVAAVFTMGFVPVSQAHADEPCVPSAGNPAESGAWSWTAFTPWQAGPAQPADPDGESGEDNIANMTQIGEGYADTADGAYRQKVSDGWQRFTPWQTDATPPAVAANEEAGHRYERTVKGEGWTETKTVVVEKAWTETIEGTPGVWANFSPNDSQATFVGPPTYPSDQRGTWHHHGDLPPGQAGPDGVYANGNAAKGGNWFYREAGTEAETIEHPAVTEEVTVEHPGGTHTEYQWDVDAFHYEYRWSVYERTNVEGTDPVTCETEPTDPTDSTDVIEPDEPTTEQPSTDEPPTAEATDDRPTPLPAARSERVGDRGLAPKHSKVPTVIDAGL